LSPASKEQAREGGGADARMASSSSTVHAGPKCKGITVEIKRDDEVDAGGGLHRMAFSLQGMGGGNMRWGRTRGD